MNLVDRTLNDDFFTLLFSGIRYPIRAESKERLLLGGLLIFPFLVTSVPILGYLIKNVQYSLFPSQSSLEGTDETEITGSTAFPHITNLRQWLHLTIIGTKGMIISAVCLLSPFALLSGTFGILSSPINSILDWGIGESTLVVGLAVLIYFYPALLGNFIESGNLRHSLKSINDSGNLTSVEYRRGVAAVLTIVMGSVLFFWLLYDLLGILAFLFVGPLVFYCLLAVHYLIGEIRKRTKAPHGADTTTESEENSTERPQASQQSLLVKLVQLLNPERITDPVSEKYKGDIDIDLYGISNWERRTRIDSICSRMFASLKRNYMWWMLLFALFGSLIQISFWIRQTSQLGLDAFLVLVSVLPALVVVVFIALRFNHGPLPMRGVLGAILLGAIATPWAWASYSLFRPMQDSGLIGKTIFAYGPNAIGVLGVLLVALLVYAYNSRITSVMDGALYGAFFGFGYILLENLNMVLTHEQLEMTLVTAVEHRGMISPTAVIFMAIIGYFVGLARINTKQAGPIIIKGLLIGIFLRGSFDVSWYLLALLRSRYSILIEQSEIYQFLSAHVPVVLWSSDLVTDTNRIFLVVSILILFAIMYHYLNRYDRYVRSRSVSAESPRSTHTHQHEPTNEYFEYAQILLNSGKLTPEEFEMVTKRL